MGQADDHVDLTFGLTFQPCSCLSLALTACHLIKVSHREGGNKETTLGKKKVIGYSIIITPKAEATAPAVLAHFVKQTLQKWDVSEDSIQKHTATQQTHTSTRHCPPPRPPAPPPPPLAVNLYHHPTPSTSLTGSMAVPKNVATRKN